MTVVRDWMGFSAMMALSFLAAGCSNPSAAQSVEAARRSGSALDRVTAGTPQQKSLTLYTSQPGRVEAFEEAPLFPKIPGYVQEVLVDIGEPVRRDQPLVKLSVPELHDDFKQKESLVALAEAELRQAEVGIEAAQAAKQTAEAKVALAEAGVGRASSEFKRWEAEHARIRQLADSGSVTTKLLDETLNQFRAAEAAQGEADANVISAQAGAREAQVNIRKAEADAAAAAARLEVAKSNLVETKTMLGYTTIAAPFDGVVTRRSVDTGHFVHPAGSGSAQPLITVTRGDKLRVSVEVPEMEAPRIDIADTATIRVQALGKDYTSRIARTSWSLDSINRSLRAEIDLENPGSILRPGMYTLVTILLEEREDVLTVPVPAIVREGDETYVCVVQAGTIRRTPVELGLRSGDDVEVVSGLKENQTIVLTRAESLKDGQQVEVSSPQK